MSEDDNRVMSDGSPVTDDHREINKETGQQKGYVVLTQADRDKGFVRKMRFSYLHSTCNTVTRMQKEIAETYARDPKFYAQTFCMHCRQHRPLSEFTWDGTEEIVGS